MYLLMRSLFLLAIAATLKTDAFIVGPAARSFVKTVALTRSSRAVSTVTARDGQTRILSAGKRDPSTKSGTALRMSDYVGGGGGSGQYEMQELHVEFKNDGTVVLEVKGVKGEACREITEELIKALGDVIHTENTDEYFEESVQELNIEGVQEQVGTGWSYDSNAPEW